MPWRVSEIGFFGAAGGVGRLLKADKEWLRVGMTGWQEIEAHRRRIKRQGVRQGRR
jgi:hypothetical protein